MKKLKVVFQNKSYPSSFADICTWPYFEKIFLKYEFKKVLGVFFFICVKYPSLDFI